MYHLKSVPLYDASELMVDFHSEPEVQVQNLGQVPVKLHDQYGQEYEARPSETMILRLDFGRGRLLQLFAYAPQGGELKVCVCSLDSFRERRVSYACFFRFVSVDAVAAEVKAQVVSEVERLRRIRP